MQKFLVRMSKNLVIVESPAKAKTIQKYLGKDFEVKSSFDISGTFLKRNGYRPCHIQS